MLPESSTKEWNRRYHAMAQTKFRRPLLSQLAQRADAVNLMLVQNGKSVTPDIWPESVSANMVSPRDSSTRLKVIDDSRVEWVRKRAPTGFEQAAGQSCSQFNYCFCGSFSFTSPMPTIRVLQQAEFLVIAEECWSASRLKPFSSASRASTLIATCFGSQTSSFTRVCSKTTREPLWMRARNHPKETVSMQVMSSFAS